MSGAIEWVVGLWQPTLFVCGVLLAAFFTWGLRSFVESNPDPFYLNFTFFAFGGQLIRAFECFADQGCRSRTDVFPMVLLFVCGGLLMLAQVRTLQAHRRTTVSYYKDALRLHRTEACKDADVDQWADAMVRITGTDFFPGAYGWMKIVDGEPRESVRKVATALLPRALFVIPSDAKDPFQVPLSDRRVLWWIYVGICALAWLVFVLTLGLSH